jgi:hypothetical protein
MTTNQSIMLEEKQLLIESDFRKDRLKSSHYNNHLVSFMYFFFQTLINHFHQLVINMNSCTLNKMVGLINLIYFLVVEFFFFY